MEKRFELYFIALQYLRGKITENLREIYLDIDIANNRMLLTAYYYKVPSALELELLDDIETNTSAPIPDFYVESVVKLLKDRSADEAHDFCLFAFFDPTNYDYKE